MGRAAVFFVTLASLGPLVARADYYVLEGDVMEGSLPPGGDLRVGAFAQTHGLALIEASDVNVTGTVFFDELDGVGRFGSGGMAPPPLSTTPISVATAYTVHLLHFELPAGMAGPSTFLATVTFDA